MKRCLPWLVLAVAAVGPAQVTKSGTGFLLRAKYTPGQTLKYVMSSDAAMGGSKQVMKMTSPIVMAVKGVKAGVAEIVVTTGPASLNGQSQGAADKRTVKLDTRNRPIGGPTNYEAFSSFELPEKPVKPGQSWKGQTKLDTPMGAVTMAATYTFVGIKTVAGKQVAEIKSAITGSMMGPIKGNSTAYLNVADGMLHSVSGKTRTEVKMSAEAAPIVVEALISVKRA